MIADFYVKLAARKSRYVPAKWELHGVPKVSKTKPSVDADEVMLRIKVEVPDAYFEDSQLEVTIKVPDRKASPFATATVAKAIGEAIKQQVGMKVHVSCDHGEELVQ